MASGALPHFPVTLFEHIGDVYRRVERAAGDDVTGIEELRLVALVHEEPPESLPRLLGSAGMLDSIPTVAAVTEGFGRIWKARTDAEIRAYVEANRLHLAPLLLFELAHEGRSIPAMERAAERGGLRDAFALWAERLTRGAGPADDR